ncbi:MAG TPA: sulfate adenylyltransferase [Bacteroidota bacterium]
MTIEPHGGTLINRCLTGDRLKTYLEKHGGAKTISVNDRILSDVYLIAIGALSPLTGFMKKSDYDSVVNTMHLPAGLAFSIPVTLSVDEVMFKSLKEGETVALKDGRGQIQAFLEIGEKFERDLKREARMVYRTEEEKHPGVQKVYEAGKYCVAGPLHYVNEKPELEFPERSLTPVQTRELFEKKGWKTVAAFQTRNPIHRAHEYLTKVALEITDGLMIHPLVGETKADDIPADVRMACYEALIAKYYKPERVVLSVLPAAMRYAGPREAIFHAIMRKNYGCTHFIVGRDHAGVGNYYGTYDAQKIFDEIDLHKFGIQPLKFEHSFFCRLCEQMVSNKTCPHDSSHHVVLSGTMVREKLAKGEDLPHEFSRPEVAEALRGWAKLNR